MNAPVDPGIADLKLDAVLRARHADAVAQLSPRVQAQLTQRRNAALRGQGHRPRHGLRYAVASVAALSALAVGLQFNHPRPATPGVNPTVAATGHAPEARSATLLDEDPEFYTWLASNDAVLAAKE
ncbi:MAG: hypothetical protein IT472_10555 [Thermomonas sp.]|uniref:hypothetical protein n=1 Tax=Thermomonas sp. TaxID=1971895 RepID=UPI002609DF2C|nr:hypothetical protein [Thermomonas sp.]MCC7097608.1 hypothetical protein [Thermomonas sp.]